ncbi:MAG: hypothetical protein ACFFCO_01325 [Promethearchaeota archaeon]
MTADKISSKSRIEVADEELHKVFHVSKKEVAFAVALLAFYIITLLFLSTNVILLIIAGMSFSLWLTFRASHWAIDGLETLGIYAGISAYTIGVLSSLASNTPEAVISALTAMRGLATAQMKLVEIAVLSVVMAAGFNILLLGFVVVVAARKEGLLKVPAEVIKDDADLIRWTIVAMALLFALGLLHYIAAIESGTPFESIPFPAIAGLMMVISYIIYAAYSISKKAPRSSEIAQPHRGKRTSVILAIIGFIGIFIAGYILTDAIERIFLHIPFDAYGIVGDQQIAIMAMIIGAAGAVPEHGIALIAAAKDKAGIAIGNTLGGTTQVLLLIVGGVSLALFPFGGLPLKAEVLLQFATAAGSLWFLKRAMTDDQRVDIFEGVMILLMQAFVFVLILTPI